MTPDEELALKRAKVGAALEVVGCPRHALEAATVATLPFVTVIAGEVRVTGGVTAQHTVWAATSGTQPRYEFDMSGDGRRDIPMKIETLIRELARCQNWAGRWLPVGSPL
jgi:hypothetical protein